MRYQLIRIFGEFFLNPTRSQNSSAAEPTGIPPSTTVSRHALLRSARNSIAPYRSHLASSAENPPHPTASNLLAKTVQSEKFPELMDITTDNNDPYVQLGVRIQRSQQEELDAWCKQNRLARSVAIRQAIDAYIKPPTNMASSLKQSFQVDEAKAIQADQLKAFRDQLEAAQKAADIKAVDKEARDGLEILLARTKALETELAALKQQVSSGVLSKQAADGDDSFLAKFAK